MKKLILVAALVAVSSSGLVAQIVRNTGDLTTLSGYDFNGSSTTTTSRVSINSRYDQQYSPYYFAGSGADNGKAAFGTVYFTAAGGGSFASARSLSTSFNAPNYLLQSTGLDVSNNSLGQQASNSKNIVLSSVGALENGRAAFKLSSLTTIVDTVAGTTTTQGFVDLNLAYSARNQGANNATIDWSYSVNGTDWTNLAGTTNVLSTAASYSVYTVDFSSIDVLEGVSTLWLGLNYSESAAGASVLLDNVAIYGTALAAVTIPEPSTYAAILGAAVAGVTLLRRRKSVLAA